MSGMRYNKRMGLTIYDADCDAYLNLKAVMEKRLMMKLSSSQMIRRMVAIAMEYETKTAPTPIDEWRSKPMAAE